MRVACVAFDPHAFDPLVRIVLDFLVCISIVRIDLDPLVAFVLRARACPSGLHLDDLVFWRA